MNGHIYTYIRDPKGYCDTNFKVQMSTPCVLDIIDFQQPLDCFFGNGTTLELVKTADTCLLSLNLYFEFYRKEEQIIYMNWNDRGSH